MIFIKEVYFNIFLFNLFSLGENIRSEKLIKMIIFYSSKAVKKAIAPKIIPGTFAAAIG